MLTLAGVEIHMSLSAEPGLIDAARNAGCEARFMGTGDCDRHWQRNWRLTLPSAAESAIVPCENPYPKQQVRWVSVELFRFNGLVLAKIESTYHYRVTRVATAELADGSVLMLIETNNRHYIADVTARCSQEDDWPMPVSDSILRACRLHVAARLEQGPFGDDPRPHILTVYGHDERDAIHLNGGW